MSADKVYAFIRYAIKVSSVTFVNIHLSFGRFIVEICLFTATFKSDIVYINADNITIK